MNQKCLMALRIALTLSALAALAIPQSSSVASASLAQKVNDEPLRPPFGLVLPGQAAKGLLVAYTSFTSLPHMARTKAGT